MIYHDRPKTLNLVQSETKSNRSGAPRTTSPAPRGQGEKEDRFDKVVASPNSKSLADRGIGYSPIYIETEEGRTLYQQQQQIIAKKASILREGLHNFCLRFLSA